ncbi:MAG TPA: DUF1801 domain-containing protein [Thermoplasmata archaeon]|nr:DUF1801 domain-containing protein [Thermoplasmata archaeon]
MVKVKGAGSTDEYIAQQSAGHQTLLRTLRALIIKAVPGLEERIMWSQPVFTSGKEKVVFLYVAGDHVNFGFFRATEVKDPKKRLEGTGKGMRHVKIRGEADIDSAYFASLVKQAATLRPK